MTINVKNTDIELKYSFRALIIYESLRGETFRPTNMTEIITFFFCCIISKNPELNLTYDDFIDWLDDNPNEINNFSQWLSETMNAQKSVSPDVKKKTTRKAKK